MLAWLERTRDWSTPLHHVEQLCTKRAVALLRTGASLDARASAGGSSPLELARQVPAEAAGHATAQVLLRAAAAWSPHTHVEPAHARAVARRDARARGLPALAGAAAVAHDGVAPVSYTHLTLPTICSV